MGLPPSCLQDAQAAAGCDPYNHFYEKRQAIAARDEAAAEGETAKQMLGHMCKVRGQRSSALPPGRAWQASLQCGDAAVRLEEGL